MEHSEEERCVASERSERCERTNKCSKRPSGHLQMRISCVETCPESLLLLLLWGRFYSETISHLLRSFAHTTHSTHSTHLLYSAPLCYARFAILALLARFALLALLACFVCSLCSWAHSLTSLTPSWDSWKSWIHVSKHALSLPGHDFLSFWWLFDRI